MPLWRRLLPGRETPVPTPRGPAPVWCGFFTDSEYARFVDRVQTWFERSGRPFRLQEGRVRLEGGPALSLLNLAQLCNRLDPSVWAEAIAAHFEHALAVEAEREALLPPAPTFEQIRDRLRLRLRPATPHEAPGPVIRTDLEGLATTLEYVLPGTTVAVDPADRARWPLPDGDVFGVALANTLAAHPPTVSSTTLSDGVEVWTLASETPFGATAALALRSFPSAIGRDGAVVGVPTRHLVLSVPVTGRVPLATLSELATLVRRAGERGPGALTHQLYAWRDGRFRRFVADRDPG